MAEFLPIPIAEQVTDHLRDEILAGRWAAEMPGRYALAKELGVNNKTVEVAIRQLEREGLLVSQGAGRRRLIQLPKHRKSRALRIGLLLYELGDQGIDYVVDFRYQLVGEGHQVTVAPKSLFDLEMRPRRLDSVVKATDVDAWIIFGGSLEVLEWFLRRKIPAFALFGRRRELMIPGVGPDKPSAIAKATRELVRLGHRRIVLLCAPGRRIPEPGASVRAFLAELAAHGIPLSRYQLPDWDGGADSLHQRLDSLFHFSPPTAMIVDEAHLFAAAQQFLARKGLRVPQDVSLLCTDHAPWFDWYRPTVAHIRWDSRPVVRRIVQWARNVSHGKQDLRQIETPAEFVPGGSIGRVRAEMG